MRFRGASAPVFASGTSYRTAWWMRSTEPPPRGILMPGVLTEVGSIPLTAEHDLLGTAVGQAAAAKGIFDGLAAYLADRPIGARYAAPIPRGTAGGVAEAGGGPGPPYRAAS